MKQISFESMDKLPNARFAVFCGQNRIKITPDLELDDTATVAQGVESLFQAGEMVAFFQVLAHALPVRERVWFACLAVRRLLPPEVKSSPCLGAAENWVYKPNTKTREQVEQAIKLADGDDPTVLAADAAFHGIVAGLEDVVKSPPAASAAMVFAAALQALYAGESDDALQDNWLALAAIAVDIAQGGNGKPDK